MTIELNLPDDLINLLVKEKYISSKSEFARLVDQGAVGVLVEQFILKMGKRKYIRFRMTTANPDNPGTPIVIETNDQTSIDR